MVDNIEDLREHGTALGRSERVGYNTWKRLKNVVEDIEDLRQCGTTLGRSERAWYCTPLGRSEGVW